MNLEHALAAAEPELTPLAVVDEERMEANLAAMARIAASAAVKLRPHAKTHKSRYVAGRQLEHGAIGLTCATLREAEVFADAGVEDLLIAHPPVGEPKRRRLAELAGRVRRLAVSIDQVELADGLPDGVEVLWEVDSGMHRMGTAPGVASADAVLELVGRVGPARVRGLLTHGGHAYKAETQEARRRAADEEAQALLETAMLLRRRGFEPRTLSVGSTPTADSAGREKGITELRPGTYVYGDANQITLGSQRLEDSALAVIATVVSVHPDRVVVDAGSKSLSSDLRVTRMEGLGIVLGHPSLRLERLSEEHGVLAGEGLDRLGIGRRLAIVPTHACTCVNLQSELLFFSATGTRWRSVDAQGWRAARNPAQRDLLDA